MPRPSRCTTGLGAAGLAIIAAACGGEVAIGVATSSAYLDAARMAVEDARSEDEGLSVRAIMVPEGNNRAAPAIAAAERLTSEPGLVAVVGHSNSSASLAASGIYNHARVVQLTPTSSAAVFSDAGPYSYRLVPPDDKQAAFIARELGTLPAGTRVALFHVGDDYGRGLREALRAALTGSNVVFVADLPYPERSPDPDDTGFARLAMDRAGPDVIVWLGRGSALDDYLPALRLGAPGAMILGSDGVASGWQYQNDDGRWDGVRHVDFVAMDASPALVEFAARYRARFGRPATVPDALTYDGVRLVLAAIANGARSGPEVQRFLDSLGRSRPAFQGLTGPIEFDDAGDVVRDYVMTALP